MAGVLFLIACMLMNTMSSCSMMAQSIGSVISGTTYPSDDPEMLAVEADYADREARLQEKIDNIESSHPGYDEYRYNLDMIGHDPHELAAVLSAVLQGYTRHSAQAELDRVFDAQYQLTLREEIQIRTYTDEDGDEHEYEYRILHVTLTSRSIASLAPELLTPEQMEMYQVYRQTMGNKPLLFGGGSPDTGVSEDLTGVEFINGTRPGNPQLVELAKSQVGNVGGYPYWSWYGFDSRVEWCACFVSWAANECGYIDSGIIPKFAGCTNGVQWFKDRGQWIDNSATPSPGMIIFFDWNNKGSSGPQDGLSDHVGIVERVEDGIIYTIEGNSGDSCRENHYAVGHYEFLGYGVPAY